MKHELRPSRIENGLAVLGTCKHCGARGVADTFGECPGPRTVPEVLPLVQALYARHAAGCCLHIVLEDGNVDDASVEFCITEASARAHDECHELAVLLGTMSRTQRAKLAAHRGES